MAAVRSDEDKNSITDTLLQEYKLIDNVKSRIENQYADEAWEAEAVTSSFRLLP